MRGSIFAMSKAIRLAGLASICLLLLNLAGCASTAIPYLATNENVIVLQALPKGKVALGQFTAQNPGLNQVSIRATSYESPFNGSYAEFLKEALRTELETAGRFAPSAPIVINGELQTNTLDASVGTGHAHISARIAIKRGGDTVYDKIVRGDNEWSSPFLGAIAIPRAAQQYDIAWEALIASLFADPDFAKIFEEY
jgi:hypothetical protein